MSGVFHISGDVSYLAERGGAAPECAYARTLGAGQCLALEHRADLAVILSGTLRAGGPHHLTARLAGPTVVLRSDLCRGPVQVIHDLRFLSMDHETCLSLIARDRAFRTLFFDAMSALIRTLAATRMGLSAYPPHMIH